MGGITASPKVIWTLVPEDLKDQILEVYSDSLNNVWWLCLAFGMCHTLSKLMTAIACLGSAMVMRNLNLKQLGEEAIRAREAESNGIDLGEGFKIKTARDG